MNPIDEAAAKAARQVFEKRQYTKRHFQTSFRDYLQTYCSGSTPTAEQEQLLDFFVEAGFLYES